MKFVHAGLCLFFVNTTFLLSTVWLGTKAWAADCRPCPYACPSLDSEKTVCNDYRDVDGQCCVELSDAKEDRSGPAIVCGTGRRCTDEERRKRGCKDYMNEKGQSCIEFAR